jgi:hypothetical protein
MIRALIAGTLAVVAAFVIARGSIAHAQTVTSTPIPTETPMVSVTPTPTTSLPSGAPRTGFGY